MKHLPRLTRSVSAFIVVRLGATAACVPVSRRARATGRCPRRALYTASDFTKLGSRESTQGSPAKPTVHVWAPPGDLWRLTAEDGNASR